MEHEEFWKIKCKKKIKSNAFFSSPRGTCEKIKLFFETLQDSLNDVADDFLLYKKIKKTNTNKKILKMHKSVRRRVSNSLIFVLRNGRVKKWREKKPNKRTAGSNRVPPRGSYIMTLEVRKTNTLESPKRWFKKKKNIVFNLSIIINERWRTNRLRSAAP